MKPKHNVFKITLACLAALAAVSAYAQDDTDIAQVLSAQPIIKQMPVQTQVCRPHMIEVQQPQQSGAPWSALLGTIAGAAVGNQVGGGNGRTVATVVGGIGGAMLGNSLGSGSGAPAQQSGQECEVHTAYENRTVGYNVVYEYAGRQRTVAMSREPGTQIRVRITPLSN